MLPQGLEHTFPDLAHDGGKEGVFGHVYVIPKVISQHNSAQKTLRNVIITSTVWTASGDLIQDYSKIPGSQEF